MFGVSQAELVCPIRGKHGGGRDVIGPSPLETRQRQPTEQSPHSVKSKALKCCYNSLYIIQRC